MQEYLKIKEGNRVQLNRALTNHTSGIVVRFDNHTVSIKSDDDNIERIYGRSAILKVLNV